MASFEDVLQPAENWAARISRAVAPHTARILIGLFLITAFATTSGVLLFVLTAQQLQSMISRPNVAATKSTIGAIRQDVASVEYYYKVLDVISKKQVDAEQALSDANAKAQNALSRMTSSADEIEAFITQNDTAYILPPLALGRFGQPPAKPPASQVDDITSPQGGSSPASAERSRSTSLADEALGPPLGSSPASNERAPPVAPVAPAQLPILDFGGKVTGYFADYYAALGPPSPQTATTRAALDTFRKLVYQPLQTFSQAHAQYDAAMSAVQSLTAQRAALDQQKTDLDDSVAPKGSALANDDYWNLCEDFFSFKTLVGDDAYRIVLFPKMMLVLTLAIFMGILGSLIYISQDFLQNPESRSFWDILFRIGLGAGVAFALFFFAAAGMLAMTQGSNQGTQADMSPYLISFLGITGGYLSDRVTQWMREVGENTFKVTGAVPPRWGVGLDEALKAASLSATALATATGATAEDADSWIALSKPVPGDKQALVAAFLRLHPSHIFTDIQPG